MYCARYQLSIHSTQQDASTRVHVALSADAAYSSTVSAAASACPSRTFVRLFVCVRYPVVFPGFLLFGTARRRINGYRFQPSRRKMRTQHLSSCLLAAGKLCRVLLLNLSRCANVNTSCAARSFRFSPFHKSSAVWYAGSAAHASLSAAAPLLTSAIIRCVTDFLAQSGILRLSVLN